MMSFAQLTGISTLVAVGIAFILADLVTLIVLEPLVRLRPRSRVATLSRFANWMARITIALVRHIGRARIDVQPSVPTHGGVLMVMNHQSLLDIPVAACTTSGCPRMVARARYGRGVPLVSHMISLYGHILVQPGRMGRRELDALAETARTSTLPILIFPEGHRTQDGEMRPWKRAGLDMFLSAREWEVYVVVVDGLWKVARLTDFVRNLARVRCRVETVGPLRYDGRGRDNHDEFVGELRRVMCAKLAEMRGAPARGPAVTAR
jgi:1-acyl-sn-glycerol-3-phosphate acyltransferase